MNIDPNDPHALDCIGSSTKCLVQFRVPYNTVEGEDLFILGSDDKLGRWNQANALPMNWGEGGNWWANVDLPAGGVFFYKYAVRGVDGSGTGRRAPTTSSCSRIRGTSPPTLSLSSTTTSRVCRDLRRTCSDEVISYEKEIVQLRMEAVKAKEMTKASLQELLVTREELEEANLKLAQYESNVQAVINSMQGSQQTRAR